MKSSGAKIKALVHATEDVKKVSTAIDNVCPSDLFDQKVETRKVKGHYGNEITTLTVSIRARSGESFVRHLMSLLSSLERTLLIQEIDKRADDDGHLYLRLDKQGCLRDQYHLLDQDPIKIELSFQVEKSSQLATLDQIRRYINSIIV